MFCFRVGATYDQAVRSRPIESEAPSAHARRTHHRDNWQQPELAVVLDRVTTQTPSQPRPQDSSTSAPLAPVISESSPRVLEATSGKISTCLRNSQDSATKTGNKNQATVSQNGVTSDILIMSLNVNGLRQKRKITALGEYISTLCPQPDICILGETHLTEEETNKFKLSPYRKAHSHCRTMEEGQIKGGVLIMVKSTVSFTKVEDLPGVELPLNSCSIWLYLKNFELPVVRLTGVYFTPAAKPKMSQVEVLTDLRSHTLRQGARPGHIITGDFNHPSWSNQYETWVSTYGIWELTDPGKRTFSSGNALDKFLYVQGDTLPAFFLGDGAPEDEEEHLQSSFYPGVTGPEERVGNHHPIFLSLPQAEQTPPPQQKRKMQIKGVSEDSWKERNQKLSALISTKQTEIARLTALGNTPRLHAMIRSLLWQVTEDLYTRKKGKQNNNKMVNLFEQFCLQHKSHHLLPELKRCHDCKDNAAEELLMSKILREDWRSYLAKIRPNNITGIYKYIRKKDGRENHTFVHQCAAPLLRDAEVVTDPKEKCELLASYFHDKLTEPQLPAHANTGEQKYPDKHTQSKTPDEPTPTLGKPKKNNKKKKPKKGRDYNTNGETIKPSTTTNFDPIRPIETTKAVADLAGNKAAGPDNLPADLFKHLPAMIPLLTTLITSILETGNIPLDLRQVLLVLLDKPGKNNQLCSSKRPISLINTTIKIIESVVYNRVVHSVEPLLHKSHYAYRRSRGTDAHLNSLTDKMLMHLTNGKFVYLASLDIQGAFDLLNHGVINTALQAANIEPNCARFIMNWTTGRSFKIRLSTPEGQHLSRARPITRGLPQGGILSPIIWVLVFSQFSREVEAALQKEDYLKAHNVEWQFYIYADDVALVVAHGDASILLQATHICSNHISKALGNLKLCLGMEKCNNMVLSPEETVGGFYRRSTGLSATLSKELPERDKRLQDLLATFSEGNLPPGNFPNGKKQQLPYNYTESFKILGVLFDSHLGFQQHFHQVIKRASVRHGVMATLAQRRWGLEASILRSTHAALLTSLMTYGLVATGGTAYERCMERLETQQANIAARKITGASKSARLAVLHMTADVLSARNLFIQQCGLSIDRALRIHSSTTQDEMQGWLDELYTISDWTTAWRKLDTQEEVLPRRGTRRSGCFGDVAVTENWVVCLLNNAPDFRGGERFKVPSIYYAEADLIQSQPHLKECTYVFGGTQSAKEVGLQVLLAINWRPDCAKADPIYVDRLPPPVTRKGKRILFGPPEANPWLAAEEVHDLCDSPPTDDNTIRVEVMPRLYRKQVLTMAYIRFPDKKVRIETRFWGRYMGKGYPKFIPEAAMLHALEIVKWINDRWPVNNNVEGNFFFVLAASNALTCSRLGKWFDTGKWHLQSSLRTTIASLICVLAAQLKFPMMCYSFTSDKPDTGIFNEHLDVGWTMLEVTFARAKKLLVAGLLTPFLHRSPRVTLTSDEVKEAIQIRYAIDEGRAINMLRGQFSAASEVIMRLGLTREIIRQALERCDNDRARQVALCSIVCTTRFKYYEGRDLFATTCLKCGMRDSFEHLAACVGLVVPEPSGDPEDMLVFLTELARRALQINPGLPVPYRGDGQQRNSDCDRTSVAFEAAGSSQPDAVSEDGGTSPASMLQDE